MLPIDEPAKPMSGFFRSLYDFSFDTFVTPKIIRVIYIIVLIVAAFWSLGILFAGFSTMSLASQFRGFGESPNGSIMFAGFVQVIGAPVSFLLASIAARVSLEFTMAVFRIAENTDAMRRQQD